MMEEGACEAGAGPRGEGARGEGSRTGKEEGAHGAGAGLGRGSGGRRSRNCGKRPRGARFDNVTSGPGRASVCGQGRRLVQAEEGERMRRPARSAPLCVAGLPGAAERERVPEQHPRVPARLRGVPAPGGG